MRRLVTLAAACAAFASGQSALAANPAQSWAQASIKAVTAHGLLSAIGAVKSAVALLAAKGTTMDDDEHRAVVGIAERQAHHLGSVLQDLVRGLPRSEENHASNGLALDPVNNKLYIAQGGNTNMGAPSNNFALLPEYALSAAIFVALIAPRTSAREAVPFLQALSYAVATTCVAAGSTSSPRRSSASVSTRGSTLP